jgi:hypothetical protein
MKWFVKYMILLLSLPILLSLDPLTYDSDYEAIYKSPEGILFLSYTNAWDEENLKQLYQELIKNKHGDEMQLLQEVRIRGGTLDSSSTKGSFHSMTNTITLYQGDKYTDVSSYSDTLSHEYGHHFAYHYLKSHHFPFSEWSKIRGLEKNPVKWDAFWNYADEDHKWYPQEIIAEDYVLLYGSRKKGNVQDLASSNEAFYLRTQHENENIPNVLENKEIFAYLEEASGLKVDENRFLKTPELIEASNQEVVFEITERKDVAYKVYFTLYEAGSKKDTKEVLKISSAGTNELKIPLQDFLNHEGSLQTVKVTIDVFDLHTLNGFKAKDNYLNIENNLISIK